MQWYERIDLFFVMILIKCNDWCFRFFDSAPSTYTEPGKTGTDEMNSNMNHMHAIGAELLARPIDQKSSSLPLFCGYAYDPNQHPNINTHGKSIDGTILMILVHCSFKRGSEE